MELIRSSQPEVQAQGNAYLNFGPSTAMVSFHPNAQPFEALLDTGAVASVIGMRFLQHHPHIQILPNPRPIHIQVAVHDSTAYNYAVIDFYFQGTLNGRPAMGQFRGEVAILPELNLNVLIGTDIMIPQQVDINLGRRMAALGCCGGLAIPLNLTNMPNPNFRPFDWPGSNRRQEVATGQFRQNTILQPQPQLQPLLQPAPAQIPPNKRRYRREQDDLSNLIADFFA